MKYKRFFMSETKDVANIGTDAHIRYALDMEKLDLSIIKDSAAISSRTERLTLQPSFVPPEFLGEKEKSTWADFPPPIAFPNERVFGEKLIDGLDPDLAKQILESIPPEDKESQIVRPFIDTVQKIMKNLELSNNGRRRFISG